MAPAPLPRRFRPNKEQRRAARKWEEFLAGAPLAAPQKQQQERQLGEQGADEGRATHGQQGQEGQEQEGGHQRLLENPDGVQYPEPGSASVGAQLGLADGAALAAQGSARGRERAAAGAAAGPGSPQQLRGTSPKRTHADLEQPLVGTAWAAGAAGGCPALGAPPVEEEDGLASKRHRGPGGGAEGQGLAAVAEQDPQDWSLLDGGSPTQQLASQMQHVLRPAPAPAAQQAQQAQQQQQARPAVDGSTLAAELDAALARCIEEATLPGPASAYPAARVQPPSARQRKLLPAGAAFTSAFPLAAAAAARRLLQAGQQQAGQPAEAAGAAPSPEAVAGLLAQRAVLPPGLSLEQQRGHLNFCMLSDGGGGGSVGAAAAAPAAQPSSGAGAGLPAEPGASSSSATSGASRAPSQDREAGGAAATGGPAGAAGAAAAAAAAASIPRRAPRHFELRTLRSEPSLVAVEFDLYKKYQVGGGQLFGGWWVILVVLKVEQEERILACGQRAVG